MEPSKDARFRVSIAASSIYSTAASQAIDRLRPRESVPEMPNIPTKYLTEIQRSISSRTRPGLQDIRYRGKRPKTSGEHHDVNLSRENWEQLHDRRKDGRAVVHQPNSSANPRPTTRSKTAFDAPAVLRARSRVDSGTQQNQIRDIARPPDSRLHTTFTTTSTQQPRGSYSPRRFGPGTQPPPTLPLRRPSFLRRLSDEGRLLGEKMGSAFRRRGSAASVGSVGEAYGGYWGSTKRQGSSASAGCAMDSSRSSISSKNNRRRDIGESKSLARSKTSARVRSARQLRHAGPNIAADHGETSAVQSTRRERFVSTHNRYPYALKPILTTRRGSESSREGRLGRPGAISAVVGHASRNTRLTDFIDFERDSLAAEFADLKSLPPVWSTFAGSDLSEDEVIGDDDEGASACHIFPLQIQRQPPRRKRINRDLKSWMPPSPLGSRSRPLPRHHGGPLRGDFRMDAEYPATADLFAELPDEEKPAAEREVERLMRSMGQRSVEQYDMSWVRKDARKDSAPSIIIDTFPHDGHTSWLVTERPNSWVIHSDYRRFSNEKREEEMVERLRNMEVGEWF